jgi:uncharacterized membrane protein YdbT with pleckstrin-like domain
VDALRGEHVVFHGHPSWRSMLGFYLKGLVAAALVGAIAGLATVHGDHQIQALWVVVAVLVVFALGLIRGALRQARTTYTITDQRLRIELGLFSREVHETMLDRIQNVRCRQSVLQRVLGVGTIEFDTAGGAEFDFRLTGVERPRWIARNVDRALQARLPTPV